LRDVATLLIDCALRPEECFRLRWENVRDDAVHILFGKTASARRVIPLTPRSNAIIEMRRSSAASTEWVFPAATKSGHIEKSTLKKQHPNACELAKVTAFPLYTFRHTCLTRWAAYMDPYTLAYLAGHSDFSTTRRYIHPQAHTVRAAMERARAG
jgi:integrase